ncbi:MAG TPA: response regulator, partial [Pirellulales bacterium]|nr:response regulator [Pirellulales bacterium]
DVTTAFDGEAAIEKAREFLPDLVLCDIAMPRLDGYAVARRIRSDKAFGSPKLIAVTAFDSDDQRRLTHEAGFDLHVVKADDPSRLNHAIKQVL